MRTPFRIAAGALAALLVVGLGACGDDDDEGAEADETTSTVAEPETIEVTAVDYAFEGLPASVEAGTVLALTNDSPAELHEIVVFRLPDDEERSLEDLLALPEEESGAVFAGGPAAVLLRAPGGAPQIDAVGDGTLSEPGRYALICSIPQGADPDAYLDAPPGDGPPQVEGGPPHFELGMYAELTVD